MMNWIIWNEWPVKSGNKSKELFILLGLAALLLPWRLQAGGLVVRDALVAHWAFDELSGVTVRDSSTNHFNGTLTGATWSSGASPLDGAMTANGPGQGVFIPADGVSAPDAIADLPYGSIVIRFKFPDTGASAIIPIFYMGQRTAQRPEQFTLIMEIGHANNVFNRKLYFTIINSGFCFDTGVNLLPETWYQFVGVVGPNGNTGYLNGEELLGRHYNLGSNSTYTNFFSSVPSRECLGIACGRYAGDFLYGPATVSDVQIYNRPLTSSEIALLYRDTMDPALFKVEGPNVSGDGSSLQISWPSDSNYSYSLLQSVDGGLVWEPEPENGHIPATPPVNTVALPLEDVGSKLFRVQATLLQPN